MKVGIIGAGNVGKALASSLTRAGHQVVVSAGSPETARAAAEQVGAQPAATNVEAARESDVIVLAVPYVQAGEEVAKEIAPVADGRIVIDVTNPVKPDYSGLAVEGTSAAEEFQRRLPAAKVVKAFNTVLAANQADPRPEVDAFLAGDDAAAKEKVTRLIDSMGFTPVDVGPLDQARHLESMAWVNIGLNAANGWSWTSAWRLENKG